jgi:hypothetical protein
VKLSWQSSGGSFYDDLIEQPSLFPRIELVVYFFRFPKNLSVLVSFDALDPLGGGRTIFY